MSDLTADTITPHLAAIVLSHRGEPGGYRPSGGATALLELADKVVDATFALDAEHQDALAKGYPGLVAAAREYQTVGGIKRLQQIAAS